MSFLFRTNKGRVVYNRRVKPFKPRDVSRITLQVVEHLTEQELEILARTLVTILVDACRLNFGAAASLQLSSNMLSSVLAYILESMSWDTLELLRIIDSQLADALQTIKDFVRWQMPRGIVKEEKKHGS